MKRLLAMLLLLVSTTTSPANKVPSTFTAKDVHCLATNIYHEARGEGYLGGLAVAVVTINRTRHEDYPSDICEVVYQKKQFSWTNSKKHKPTINAASVYLAKVALSERHELRNLKATHYHTMKVRPKWRTKLQQVARIGQHVFYKQRA